MPSPFGTHIRFALVLRPFCTALIVRPALRWRSYSGVFAPELLAWELHFVRLVAWYFALQPSL